MAEGLVVCDTGTVVSALNKREGRRNTFAAEILASYGARAIIPWPVYVETDLLLRSRGFAANGVRFGRALLAGEHSLLSLTDAQLELALTLLDRYEGVGLDLPDASVMAVSLLIAENEVPAS